MHIYDLRLALKHLHKIHDQVVSRKLLHNVWDQRLCLTLKSIDVIDLVGKYLEQLNKKMSFVAD